MKKIIVIFLALIVFEFVANAQTDTRGIGVDEAPAVFYDGRYMWAPKGSTTNSAGAGMTAAKNPSVSLTASSSTTREKVWGIYIPKGTRVNVFPRNGGFYGDKVSIPGTKTTYANKAMKKALSNKSEECILIGLPETGMWYYVPRRCLVQ